VSSTTATGTSTTPGECDADQVEVVPATADSERFCRAANFSFGSYLPVEVVITAINIGQATVQGGAVVQLVGDGAGSATVQIASRVVGGRVSVRSDELGMSVDASSFASTALDASLSRGL
jgi:hypothetical protein